MSADEILCDNCHHGTCDNMNGEIDKIVRMEVSLESVQCKTDNVELGSPRNDDVDKVNKLFHREVCKMEAKCFIELCFTTVDNSQLDGSDNAANPECSPSVWLHVMGPYFHGTTCTFNQSPINMDSIAFDQGHSTLLAHFSLSIAKFNTFSNLLLRNS